MNSEKIKAKNTPNAANIWWKLVNVPEISVGDVSFMISGANELPKPATTPWRSLATTRTSKVGTKTKKPTINATRLAIRAFLLKILN
jgi:hypothetical protein